jgi:probable rRNA maturation factor
MTNARKTVPARRSPTPARKGRRDGVAVSASVTIDLALRSARWRKALPDAAERAEAAARAALAGARRRLPHATELSIVLGDDALVRTLNARWRGRDRPTNVLSFASGEKRRAQHPHLLGDVVLAFETVAGEAAAQQKPLADHLMHLVAHGVLHLLGFDHGRAAEASRMEALERRVLKGVGVPDPYRERAPAHV